MRYRRSRSPIEERSHRWSNPPPYTFGLLPDGGRFQDYPLVRAECNYRLVDVYVSAVLQHTFKSRSTQQAHVSYVFPLPQDATVHAFTAHIEDRVVKGVVKEKAQARADYDRAVAQNRQAALLQQENVEVFKLMLGNVRPGQTVTVHISFVSLISQEGVNDTLRLTFPTSIAPRYGSPPGDGAAASGGLGNSSTMNFALSVAVGANITSISSPSHPITSQLGSSISQPQETFDPTMAHISLSSSTFLQDDIVIIISSRNMDRQRCVAESYVSEDGKMTTNAYALTLVPRFKLPFLPQSEFLFLVDCSGSMAGGKIRALRGALQIMLKSLPSKGTTFNIVRFGSSQDKLWHQAVPYTAENVQTASRYVSHMGADLGGTEMELGLKAAFSSRTSASTPTSVLVLTDGECWELDAVQAAIRRNVDLSRGTTSFLRVFCMGIGNAVSKAMCEGIARAGNGHAVYVGEDENIGQKLINLIRAAHTPPVQDLLVDWGIPEVGADDEAFEQLGIEQPVQQLSLFDEAHNEEQDRAANLIGPAPSTFWQHPPQGLISSLQPGSRYSFFAISKRESANQGLSERIQLRGTVLGQPINLEVPVTSFHCTAGVAGLSDKLIHLLAARAMIQDFEEQGSKDQVLNMALTYGLASSQTSFVAVDLSERETDQRPQAMEHPQVAPPSRHRSVSPHPAVYARHGDNRLVDRERTLMHGQAPMIIMAPSNRSRSRSPPPYRAYRVATQPPSVMARARHSPSPDRYSPTHSAPFIVESPTRVSGRTHSPQRRSVNNTQPTIIYSNRRRSRSRSRSIGSAYSRMSSQSITMAPGSDRRRSRSPRAYAPPTPFVPPAQGMSRAPIIMTAPSRRSRSRSPRHHQSSVGTQEPIVIASRTRSRSRSRSRYDSYARIPASADTREPIVTTANSRRSRSPIYSPRRRAPSPQARVAQQLERSRSRSPSRSRERIAPREAVASAKPSAGGRPAGDSKGSKRQSIGSKVGTTIGRLFRRKNTGGDAQGPVPDEPKPTVTSTPEIARPEEVPDELNYQSPVIVDRWRRRASVSSWVSNQTSSDPTSVPIQSPNHLERSVASIACAQAFDGSFGPTQELVLLLTDQDTLPDLPPTLRMLKLDDSMKRTLWCSILVLVFLDVYFAAEKDSWTIFAEKTQNWMEETLDQTGLDWPRIDAALHELRYAGTQVLGSQ